LLNFAVHLNWRRLGIGSQMIKILAAKLSPRKFRRITAEIRETNLSAQLFLRECGFKAINTLHRHYKNISEDAYLMQYKYREPQEKQDSKTENFSTRIIGNLLDSK